MAASLSQKRDERVDCTMEFARTLRIHETLTIIIKDNIWLTKTARALLRAKRKRRGFPRRSVFFGLIFDQRSSWSTLCCDWLASASAETAIDWRVDSAWLLAASSFGSASVRFDAPVCNTLIRLLLKSWRICTTDRFEPRFEASERSRLEAPCNAVSTLLVALLSMKSVPTVRLERPRPAELKFAPVMLSVEVPVSLNTSFSVSPFSRLMPLNEESCAVVVICDRMLLYCEIRPARVAWAFGSTTGGGDTLPLNRLLELVTAPIVCEASSLEVMMVRLPLASTVACRLFAASAVFSSFRLLIWLAPVPNVTLVAVPVPTAAIDRVELRASAEFEDCVRGKVVVAVPLPMPSEASRLVLLELMLRSALVPVEIWSAPAATEEAVPVPAASVATPVPVLIVAVCAPVAMSIAVSRSVTVPAGVPATPRYTVELPLPSVRTLPTRPEVPAAAAGIAPVLKVMV